MLLIPFSRKVEIKEKALLRIQSLLEDYVIRHSVLLAQLEHILSFKLMGIGRMTLGLQFRRLPSCAEILVGLFRLNAGMIRGTEQFARTKSSQNLRGMTLRGVESSPSLQTQEETPSSGRLKIGRENQSNDLEISNDQLELALSRGGPSQDWVEFGQQSRKIGFLGVWDKLELAETLTDSQTLSFRYANSLIKTLHDLQFLLLPGSDRSCHHDAQSMSVGD